MLNERIDLGNLLERQLEGEQVMQPLDVHRVGW